MEFVYVLCVVLAVADGVHASPPAAECSGLSDGRSVMAVMLHALGFNDTCVAASLDFCSSAQDDGDLRSFLETVLGTVQQNDTMVNKSESRPRHCKDLLDSGDSGSGLRQVYPNPERPHHAVTVYCEQDVDGGGWTVFQRRVNNPVRENFYRNWKEYQAGFGDLNGEFWLGLDHLHDLCSTPQELRIDLSDYEGERRWAKYGTFKIGAEDTNYRLTVGRYSGDAGDSMAYHNGYEFSTHDGDHDAMLWGSGNCAEKDTGGWWFNSCAHSHLNGYQHVGQHPRSNGIYWYHWRGWNYSLMRTSMMVRPVL